MKNITLIKSIINNAIDSLTANQLVENITMLVQSHPEETRENVLALLTGTAILTIRPVEQVEIIMKPGSKNYQFVNISSSSVDHLAGTVKFSYEYTYNETCYYKSQEDMDAGKNSSWDSSDKPFSKMQTLSGNNSKTVTLAEWNTGKLNIER